MSRFAQKVVVITGAGAGVGRTYAERFAAEGAQVIIVDLDGDAAEKTAARLSSEGGRALAVQMDVIDEASARAMADRAVREFGGIDILINNAGVHLEQAMPPVSQETLPEWKRVFDVNLYGALNCAVACLEPMRRRGGGVILNQSSSGAWRSEEAYDVSKMALNALTAVLGHKLADDGIRVVGVAPGLIDTPAAMASFDEDRIKRTLGRQQVKRVMRMGDLADVVLFLCSDEGSFIAGTTVVIDGGMRQKAW